MDIQGLTGSPFTQYRDKAGNWTRNKRSQALVYGYTHDAWNRVVKVEKLQTVQPTLGEYEYNGLHWRTVKHVPGSSATEERRMYYSASWQLLEERVDSDPTDGSGSFAEEKCSQTVWGLRYIDDAVLRRTDTNQDYDYADTGERTDYLLTDPQFSVVAVVDDTGALQERIAYSAYGEARHHFPGDMDGDGDTDSTDSMWFTNLNHLKDIDESGYNPDGDLNRDGKVDSADISIYSGWTNRAALAKGQVSDPAGPGSPIGYDGYVFNAETKLYTVRFRHYEPLLGRWLERDPLEYQDGLNPIEYVRGRSLRATDPLGLEACKKCEKGNVRFVGIGTATTKWGAIANPDERDAALGGAKTMLGKKWSGKALNAAVNGRSAVIVIVTKLRSGDEAASLAYSLAWSHGTNYISEGLDKLAEDARTKEFSLWALTRTQTCTCPSSWIGMKLKGCKWQTTDSKWSKCSNPKMATTGGATDYFHDVDQLTPQVIEQCLSKAEDAAEDKYWEDHGGVPPPPHRELD